MTRIDPVISPEAHTPQVHLHGEVSPEARAYAVKKLQAALHHAPGPVLHVQLSLAATPYGERVDSHVDVDGVRVHVHAVAETLQEATDLMQERLRSRLRRIRRRTGRLVTRVPGRAAR